MEFAKAQMLKYGWTEGKGLGKNEDGMLTALKPKLKFDTTGIGHDDKEFKWWESVYNKASSNVEISKKKDEVIVSVRDKDAVEISTAKISRKKLSKSKKLTYGNFMKTCTLDQGKVVPENDSENAKFEECEEKPNFVELSDEALFEACGGRTAHKGARHGLKLNGKLARIARQEAEMLKKLTGSPKTEKTEEDSHRTDSEKRKRKKLKK